MNTHTPFSNWKRTATCGELRASHAGSTVILNGWVHRYRDHGGIHFINLRDRYGITQVVVDNDSPQEALKIAEALKSEYCIGIKGIVRKRPDNMINPSMETGEIEVHAKELVIFSPCEVLPFTIDEKTDAREDLRLEYRYLDLRSVRMQRNIELRHKVAWHAREYLVSRGFYEIETPTFIRSTPEGARDFLVPSRLHRGKFYALPQSPQLFKQLLMVSGFDKYFQIARCYRDEDARGDRQPEFTQIDMEMSFVDQDDVLAVTEGLMAHIMGKSMDVQLKTPFPRISYHEAMEKYGSDKPDLRFGLEMQDFAPYAENSDFGVFKSVLSSGGAVRALVVPGGAAFSRKDIDELEKAAKTYKAKGLAWFKLTEEGLEGGISKFFAEQRNAIISGLGAKAGDIVLMVADKWQVCCTALGAVRNAVAKKLELIPEGSFAFCWITDFPLFEYNEDEGRWEAAHHMFTMPREEHLELLEKDPGAVRAAAYDLVCNGYELASGSIRVHDPAIQKRIFSVVGFSEEEAEKRFGFLLKAFRYGPPPHGGIAPGLDRLVMIMAGEDSIRDVIAFPKNTVGASPMDESPAEVDKAQLDELGIIIKKEEE
ncbi:aspartate--tRNA ligase [Spirochaetia bacterium 38H-sp]|uniref:Aspartate--tRNA(Asp/Asn) ligase n=1 Tax=Rarispira pelagica TaxID=3141764 RepID=A0ABU9U8T4_9SPIR